MSGVFTHICVIHRVRLSSWSLVKVFLGYTLSQKMYLQWNVSCVRLDAFYCTNPPAKEQRSFSALEMTFSEYDSEEILLFALPLLSPSLCILSKEFKTFCEWMRTEEGVDKRQDLLLSIHLMPCILWKDTRHFVIAILSLKITPQENPQDILYFL